MILGMPHMILRVVHKWSPLHLSDSLLHPFLSHCLSFLAREMAHGDDRGKLPRDEGSSLGSGSPPPCQMMMMVGAHWLHVVSR
jgi:hypothetical protein